MPILRSVLVKVIDNQLILQLVMSVELLLFIFIIVGIIQIKKISTRIAIVIFSSMVIFNIVTTLSFFAVRSFSNVRIMLFGLFIKLVMISASAGCVYYLLRPGFRSFQLKYLESKQQESQAKWVQKNAHKF